MTHILLTKMYVIQQNFKLKVFNEDKLFDIFLKQIVLSEEDP